MKRQKYPASVIKVGTTLYTASGIVWDGKAGIDVIPYPVDYRQFNSTVHLSLNANMAELNQVVREWIGLGAYYLTEKTTELIPGPLASAPLLTGTLDN